MSMQVHINLIIKSIIFLTLITFSLYFLYFGYNELNKADIKVKSRSNIDTSKISLKEKKYQNNRIMKLIYLYFKNLKKINGIKMIILKK